MDKLKWEDPNIQIISMEDISGNHGTGSDGGSAGVNATIAGS